MSFIHAKERTTRGRGPELNRKKNLGCRLSWLWLVVVERESFGQRFFYCEDNKPVSRSLYSLWSVGRSVGPPSAPPPPQKTLRIYTIHINYLFLVQNGEFRRKVTSLQVCIKVVLPAGIFYHSVLFFFSSRENASQTRTRNKNLKAHLTGGNVAMATLNKTVNK